MKKIVLVLSFIFLLPFVWAEYSVVQQESPDWFDDHSWEDGNYTFEMKWNYTLNNDAIPIIEIKGINYSMYDGCYKNRQLHIMFDDNTRDVYCVSEGDVENNIVYLPQGAWDYEVSMYFLYGDVMMVEPFDYIKMPFIYSDIEQSTQGIYLYCTFQTPKSQQIANYYVGHCPGFDVYEEIKKDTKYFVSIDAIKITYDPKNKIWNEETFNVKNKTYDILVNTPPMPQGILDNAQMRLIDSIKSFICDLLPFVWWCD
jgi:hypothetical protein